MATRNTVPTPIVDKNGKQTTVHKSDGEANVSKRLSGVKAPKPSSSVYEPDTLASIRKNAESNVAVSGADATTPEGYSNAIVKILGITTNYILRDHSSGDQERSEVVGRVEFDNRTVVRGGRLKGGEYAGTFKGFDDVFDQILGKDNHSEYMKRLGLAVDYENALTEDSKPDLEAVASRLVEVGRSTRDDMLRTVDEYATDENAKSFARNAIETSFAQYNPEDRDEVDIYPDLVAQTIIDAAH